jgi:hypothetical protein
MSQITTEKGYVEEVLAAGRDRANEVASKTLFDAKKAMGLYV